MSSRNSQDHCQSLSREASALPWDLHYIECNEYRKQLFLKLRTICSKFFLRKCQQNLAINK